MAEENTIRVVIEGVATDLRRALEGAKGDLGGLSAAIKAVPDNIRIDVQAQIAAAASRLETLTTLADGVPRKIDISASADTGVATAQLKLLQAEIAKTERASASAFLARAGIGPGVAGAAPGAPQVLSGVRGTDRPGSIINPEVVVLESGAMTPLGSRAAAIGQAGGTQPVAVAPSAGDGGRGGGVPVAVGAAGAGDRGGGGAALLYGGGGIAGLAAAGSALSLAGLGFEHALTTLIGLATYAAAGFAGAGALMAGTFGNLAVGAGSDLAVMTSTITDTKALSTSLDALQTATATYGAKSTQAATAQKALNVQIADLGNTAGVRAEVGLAKAAEALNHFWDIQTSGARVAAVNVLQQVLQLGTDYVPLVAKAAQQNLTIVNQSLKPLFAWLEGPQGVGIFQNLENHFRAQLPTAMDAFKQGVELVLRIVNLASNYTGHFIDALDKLLTRLNAKNDFTLNGVIAKLIGDFRAWEALFKVLAQDVYDFFHQGVGTAPAIVQWLTQMLDRLHAWETSVQGSQQIRTIFLIHKEEIIALLNALVPLVVAFGHFYIAIAPPLVAAVTAIAKVFADVLNAILALGRASPVLQNVLVLPLGGLLIAAKLFSATKVWDGIKATAAAFGILTGAQSANAAAANAATAANVRLDAAVGVGGAAKASQAAAGAAGVQAAVTGATSGSAVSSTVAGETSAGMLAGLKAGAIRALAIGGIGTLLSQGIGDSVKGGVGTAISNIGTDASLGASFGSFFGPEGIAGGALIGGLVGTFQTFISDHADDFGKKLASAITKPLPAAVAQHYQQSIADALNKANDLAQQAASPAGPTGGPNHGRGPNPRGTLFEQPAALSEAQLKAWADSGRKIGEAVVAGLRGVRAPSTVQLLSDFQMVLQKTPPQARAAAAQTMIDWAETLVAKGELPKGAVNTMIQSIKAMFPGLTLAFQRLGLTSEQALADAMKFDAAKSNLTQTVQDVKDKYKIWEISSKLTGDNLWTNMGIAMTHLHDIVNTSTGRTRDDALHNLKQLHDQAISYFNDMSTKVAAASADMRNAVASGSQQAYQIGAGNWSAFAKQVGAAEQNMVINVGEGNKLIVDALNKQLQAFGEKPLAAVTVASMTPAQLQAVASGQVSSGAAASPHAGGGLIQVGRPGERGQDTVAMNAGGVPIKVGAGEQVAVFNAQQQQVMNSRLADMGGLGGMFSRFNRPHYMSRGGMFTTGGTVGGGGVGPVAGGGNLQGDVYPFPPGTSLGRVDMGIDASMPVGSPIGPIGPARYGSSRPWGGAAGNQPIMWWQLVSGPRAGSWVYLAEQIIPRPWSGILQPDQAAATFAGSGTGIEMGWWNTAGDSGNTLAQQQGLTGFPTPQGQDFAAFISGLAHGVVTGGAGGVSAARVIPTLNAPAVHGKGALADLVRGVLKKDTAAANRFLRSHAGAIGASGSSAGFPSSPGGWFRVGATIDPTGGQTGDPNMTFAELLEAGANAGMRPDLTQLLGEPRGSFGMPMGTAIQIRQPGGGTAFRITKNDVGSGQPGNPHFLIDLHPGIASALGWTPNQDVEVKHGARGLLFAQGGKPDRTGGPPASFPAGPEPRSDYPRPGVEHRGQHAVGGRHPFSPFTPRDLRELAAVGQTIAAIEQDAKSKQAQFGSLGTRFQAIEGESRYLNPDGTENPAGVRLQIADQTRLENLAEALLDDYQRELPIVSGTLKKFLGPSGLARGAKTISFDDAKIAADKRRLQANRVRERQLQGEFNRNFDQNPLHRLSVAASGRLRGELIGLRVQDAKIRARDHGLSAFMGTLGAIRSGSGQGAAEATITALLQTVAPQLGTVELGSHGQFLGIDTAGQGEAFDEGSTIQGIKNTIAGLHRQQHQGPDLSALNALLTTQLQQSELAFALSQSQFGVLSGFAPMLEGRTLGSFQTGVDRVPRTGPYLLHRDEMVIPDPYGAQYNRAATVHTAQQPVEIVVLMGNDEKPLMKIVDARINGQALRVVSEHAGQRARLLSGVRRP